MKSKILIGVAVVAISFIAAMLLRSDKRSIQASIAPTTIFVGEAVDYMDSTKNARIWLWEFGNGDLSKDQWGTYYFAKIGKYQVRLTVDGKLEENFIIEVRSRNQEAYTNPLIKIDAPTEVLQGEYVVFTGSGEAKQWRWMFGESGIVDSRDKVGVYAYTQPGQYQVSLSTETTEYPIEHTINVLPLYSKHDTTDVLSLIGEDIREKLQAIANGKPFNNNYNYIMKTYLCNKSNTPVSINNIKLNDFYSYCQGLRMIGRGSLIDRVMVIQDTAYSECIQKLIVSQFQVAEQK